MMTSRAILICFSLSFFFYLFSFSATEQLPFSPQTLQIRVRVVHYLPPGLTAKSDTSPVWGGGDTTALLAAAAKSRRLSPGAKR